MARRLAASICLLIVTISLANAQVKPQRVRVSSGVAQRLTRPQSPTYLSDRRQEAAHRG